MLLDGEFCIVEKENNEAVTSHLSNIEIFSKVRLLKAETLERRINNKWKKSLLKPD